MTTYRGDELPKPDRLDEDLLLVGARVPGMEDVEQELDLPPEAGADYVPMPGHKGYMATQPEAERYQKGGAVRTHDDYPARQNADGTQSTEVSVTTNDPRLNHGQWTNIPSLWEGKEVPEEEAVERVNKTERKYPSFDTMDDAVRAAEARSNEGGAGQVDRGYSTYNTRDVVTGSYQQGGMVKQPACKYGSSTVVTCQTKHR